MLNSSFRLVYGVLIICLSLPFLAGEALASGPAPTIPSSAVDPILTDAEQVLQDLIADKAMIARLQDKIQELQNDTQSSAQLLKSQKDLLAIYQARVETLEKRYGTLLTLAERLKQESQTARTVAFIAVPVGIVAVILAVLEGVALAGK